MSLLASYFVLNEKQAEAVSRGESGDGAVEGPPLLPTDLGDLQRRMIGHESWSLVGDMPQTWLVRVGDDFVAKLASLPEAGDQLADEFQLSTDELDTVELLRALAIRAKSSGLSVYILISL